MTIKENQPQGQEQQDDFAELGQQLGACGSVASGFTEDESLTGNALVNLPEQTPTTATGEATCESGDGKTFGNGTLSRASSSDSIDGEIESMFSRRSMLKQMKMIEHSESIQKSHRPGFDVKKLLADDDLLAKSRNIRHSMEEAITDGSADEGSSSIFAEDPIDDCDTSSQYSTWSAGDPLHDPDTRLGAARNWVGKQFNSTPFQIFNTAMIAINAALLGVLTFLYNNPEMTETLEFVDMIMLVFFTAENAAQLFYHGKLYLDSGWLMFDGLVISFSWIFNNSSLGVLRSFRIFRVFILVSKFESFKLLARAVVRTIPKMKTIFYVLLMFFYVFCVVFTNLYHPLYEEGVTTEDYFSRLDKTFLTLFQLMTLDSWADMVREVIIPHPWALFGFCVWIFVTAFLFINLIVAVICESLIEMSSLKEKQKEMAVRSRQAELGDGTEILMNETQQILAFQREMLANQLLMQQTIIEVAGRLPSPDPANSDITKKGLSASLPVTKRRARRRLSNGL